MSSYAGQVDGAPRVTDHMGSRGRRGDGCAGCRAATVEKQSTPRAETSAGRRHHVAEGAIRLQHLVVRFMLTRYNSHI